MIKIAAKVRVFGKAVNSLPACPVQMPIEKYVVEGMN
jgi:hypothetical protein